MSIKIFEGFSREEMKKKGWTDEMLDEKDKYDRDEAASLGFGTKPFFPFSQGKKLIFIRRDGTACTCPFKINEAKECGANINFHSGMFFAVLF